LGIGEDQSVFVITRTGNSTVSPQASVLAVLLTASLAGCFSEQSLPMYPDDLVRMRAARAELAAAPRPRTAREWLAVRHGPLEHLLPPKDHKPLLTEQMSVKPGKPRDVYAYFDEDPERLHQLFHTYHGLLHTAQAVSPAVSVDGAPSAWEGFSQVWVPVAEGVELSGRLAFVERDGRVVDADCIVVLPGFFGDNGAQRACDLGQALRSAGFHVLSLELRGHGQTEARHPDVAFTFGVLETGDLLKVSEWLVRQPHVRRTGLVSYSWGGNLVLLATWLDASGVDHPGVSEWVRREQASISSEGHYEMGVIAFSPVVNWEDLMYRLDEPVSMCANPIRAFLQGTIRDRMERKGHSPITGSLRELIQHEFANSILTAAFPVGEAYQFLRLIPYSAMPAGDKLEASRVPTLIVHAVNDACASAQAVADLVAATDNPNVAAVMLAGGGHIGFAPYARAYYYDLILGFFDPETGAAAAAMTNDEARMTKEARMPKSESKDR